VEVLNEPEKSDCPFNAVFASLVMMSDSVDTCCSSSADVLTLLSVVVVLLADVSFLQEYMVMQDSRQNAMAIRRIRFAFIMTIIFS
jgi:hypothetical protein